MRFGYAFGAVVLLAAIADGCSSTSEPGPGPIGVGGGATVGPATTGAGEGGFGGAPAPCSPECTGGLTCCDGVCVNVDNDVHNCGMCFKNCPGPHAFCDTGSCDQAPCAMQTGCEAGSFCCGAQCCPFEVLCCDIAGALECTTPNENGTCPP